MKRIAATDPDAVAAFRQVIQDGGVVVYPTDTLYGLGTDTFQREAVDQITAIKGRQGPFSVMVGHLDQLAEYALVSPENADKFEDMLPGPYTFLLPPQCPEIFPPSVKGPGGKVGFRVPGHPFIQAAFQQWQGLVITTSVNRTGRPPLQDPALIQEQFGEQVDLLVDAGPLPPSRGSTVVDVSFEPWHILRRGEGKV